MAAIPSAEVISAGLGTKVPKFPLRLILIQASCRGRVKRKWLTAVFTVLIKSSFLSQCSFNELSGRISEHVHEWLTGIILP